jgi:phosphatidylserine/phosphatidylglycerophosphate/cardiolipin synthase-like enzyme
MFLALLLLTFVRVPLNASELYLLPEDSQKALSAILKSIDHSQKSIRIMIYNFTHKKIAKRLKNAAKRGVKVEIIFDQKNSRSDKRRSMLYFLAKYKNIFVYKLKGKYIKQQDRFGIMHMKSAVFDHRHVIFGSANWTYSAFGKNYEMLYEDDDYAKAKKLEKNFEKMKKASIPFR